VALHRQRKGARAVTERKRLKVALLFLATHEGKSGSLRSPPDPPCGHLIPQAGEGLEPHRARRRGVCSLRRVSLHKQRKVARAVTARKPLILMLLQQEDIKSSSLRSPPHPALRATFSRKREKGCLPCFPQAGEGLFNRCPAGGEGLFNRCPAGGEGLLGRFPAGGFAPEDALQGRWRRQIDDGNRPAALAIGQPGHS